MESRLSAFSPQLGSSASEHVSGPLSEVIHLIGRFFGSIRPGAPPSADLAWADEHLVAGERALLRRMSNPDQRHSIAVAREVARELPDAPRSVIAAALMHDVGKVESGFRTPARVGATLLWAVADEGMADRWLSARGTRRRLAEYRRHPEIGERLLVDAGADPLTAGWAADHHKPADKWRIEATLGDVLKRCDDD